MKEAGPVHSVISIGASAILRRSNEGTPKFTSDGVVVFFTAFRAFSYVFCFWTTGGTGREEIIVIGSQDCPTTPTPEFYTSIMVLVFTHGIPLVGVDG